MSMAAVGRSTRNAYAERVIRSPKEQRGRVPEDYEDYEEVYHCIGHFPWPVGQDRLDDVYMAKRVHSVLGYLTPAEFEALHLAQPCA